MPVLGLRGTGSFSADERPKNFRGILLLLKPNTRAPLTALLGQLRNEPTDDPEFKIFIKALPSQASTVNGAQTAADTTIELKPVATGEEKKFKKGHAVLNTRTMEVIWVTADPTTADQITVSRGKGTTAAAMNDGDTLLILGSHHLEGAAVPTSITYDPTVVNNFTQIFRTSVDLTGTAQATRLRYADNPLVEMRREALEIHSIEMEKQFLFGSGVEDTSGTQPERTTKGMFNFITTNVKDFLEVVSIDDWEDFLKDVFADGSDEKLFLTGNQGSNVINKVARAHGSIELTPGGESFGMRMQTYITPYGNLQIKQHPLLTKEPTFADWGFVVDPAHVVYRFLRGRDTRYLRNRQNAGDDVTKDEYMSEAGLELQFEQVHAVAKNMAAFVP